VSVLDTNPKRLAYLSDIFEGRADLVIPNRARTAAYVRGADVVIGAVLVAGAKAPKIVTRDMVASMRDGSVIVDVAVDQGGCIETSRPTTHSDPTYVEEGVVHYCVANIPGAVARTSTLALTSVTLPYILEIADYGVEGAAQRDPALLKGLSILNGHLVSEPVAEAHGLPYESAEELLGGYEVPHRQRRMLGGGLQNHLWALRRLDFACATDKRKGADEVRGSGGGGHAANRGGARVARWPGR
jgi:alanine dehydrogenase